MGAHAVTSGAGPQWKQLFFLLMAFLVFGYAGVFAQEVPSFTSEKLYLDEPVETPLEDDEESEDVQPAKPNKADKPKTAPPDEPFVVSPPDASVPSSDIDIVPSDEPGKPLAEEPTASPPSTLLRIESIVMEGNAALGLDVIQQRLAPLLPYEIQEPALTGLNLFTKAITDLYHEKGYLLAEAYLPEQEIDGGVLKIAVLEGVLGKLTVTGNTVYPASFIEGHFQEGKVIAHSSFERSMLLLNEYDDLTATGIFQTGITPGSADFTIQVNDRKPLHYSLDYNNFGSSFISRHRFGIGLTLGNLARYGDRILLYGIVGSPVKDMYYGRIDYGMPVRTNGTRLNFLYDHGDSDIGKSLADLQIGMKTRGWGISATHPFIKTRVSHLTGEVGLEGHDFQRSSEFLVLKRTDRTRLIHLDAHYNKWIEGGHRNSARASLRQGLGEILGAMPDNDPEASREGADNGFTKGVFEVGRFQRFTDLVSLMMRGTAQIGSDTLVVGEQFSLGGPNSVRGYSVGEFLTDHGYAVIVEMQVSPLQQKELLKVVFFVDQGEGSLKNAPTGTPKKRSFTGAGFGVRIHHDYGIKTEEPKRPFGMDILADVGYPVGADPTTKVGAAYYVHAVWRY